MPRLLNALSSARPIACAVAALLACPRPGAAQQTPGHLPHDAHRSGHAHEATWTAQQDPQSGGADAAQGHAMWFPTVRLVGDFVFAGTNRDDSFEDHNKFSVRGVELGAEGQVDPGVRYLFYAHFDEEDIELEEAYLHAEDLLPLSLRGTAGRFNLDFGQLSALHDHELPFVDKPQVLQEYLGGTLRGTGVMLGKIHGTMDGHALRWSLALVNELDGDSHAVFGPAAGHAHEADEVEPFGKRDFNNMAANARLAWRCRLASGGSIQVGASTAYAPKARRFFAPATIAAPATTVELRNLIVGADVAVDSRNSEHDRGFRAIAELLYSARENSDDGVSITDVGAVGGYLSFESFLDGHWSVGASGGHYQHAEDDAESSWDAGLFVTHGWSEAHRIRLEGRYFDDPTEDYYGVVLQWVVTLGAHHHASAW